LRKFGLIQFESVDREKSENYFIESSSKEESDRGTLLWLIQVSAREFAAFKKVRAFSYG